MRAVYRDLTAMTALSAVPIFPLHAVLFPEGKLPLRIFEPRYLELVKRSLKEDTPFVIAALLSGQEVLSGAPEAGLLESPPWPASCGSSILIPLPTGPWASPWPRRDGFVLIATGKGRGGSSRISRRLALVHGATSGGSGALLQVLSQLAGASRRGKACTGGTLGRGVVRGGRLTELLPFTPGFKQALLAEVDPLQMLDAVGAELDELREADGA